MKRTAIALALTCLITSVATAGASVWEDLATYRYGAPEKTAERAIKLLSDTPADQHGAIEEALIGVVSNRDATQDGKAFACRILQRIGKEKCVPAVSGLLEDEVLSVYARFVLQRIKGSAKAAEALRASLGSAPNKVKVGILGSLGELRDEKTVRHAGRIAKSSDPAVASAAMMALGKIGSPAAADELTRLSVRESLERAHMNALITCARKLDGSGAASLYRQVTKSKSAVHRVAAMQGLAAADAKAGAAMIADALKGDDPKMRNGAISTVVMVKGAQLTKAVTAMLDDQPAIQRASLIVALGSRGDITALDAVTPYIKSDEAAVRDAAIGALGSLGDSNTVKILLDLAESREVSGQVKKALIRMKDLDTNRALIDALSRDSTRAMVIQVLSARNCTEATPRLLELLKDGDADVRKEAWSGLGTLGGEETIEAAMRAVVRIDDGNELRHALNAVKRIYSTAEDKGNCFDVISGFYDQATGPIKTVLLELAAAAGSPAALELERKALESGDKDLRKAAIRALASWPNTAAAAELYSLATSAREDLDRALALRGYLNIAGSGRIRMSNDDRLKMFKKADGLVKRAAEKKQLISGLPRTRSPEGLRMVVKYMDDPEVKREAEIAAGNLLWDTRRHKSEESQRLARRLLKSLNRGVRQKAERTVAEWSKGR